MISPNSLTGFSQIKEGLRKKSLVLVTGAAGFIGSHLCEALVAKGYRVIGVDNLSMGKLENLASLLKSSGQRSRRRFERSFGSRHGWDFQFYKLDILSFRRLAEVSRKVEAIVHLAAYKIPRYGNAIDTLRINNRGTTNVLEIARKLRCKVLVASTSDVYGKNPSVPYTENHDLLIGPSTVSRWSYAVSKIFDEHLSLAYQESYGFPVVLMRFFGAYGPRHHLSWWGGAQAVFIEAILRAGAERKDAVIPIHGDGRQTRTFTYVSDTVAGIMAALERPGTNGEIINIGSDREISILELARLIKKLAHTPGQLKFEFIPYNKLYKGYEDASRRVPDLTKAQRLLGFCPRTSLEEGLQKTIEWQRKIP